MELSDRGVSNAFNTPFGLLRTVIYFTDRSPNLFG